LERSVKAFHITAQKRKYLPFNEVREFARSLKLQGKEEWEKYVKNNILPEGVSSRPDAMYRNKGWINWRDFLGSDVVPFSEAREYAHKLGLTSMREWQKYTKEKGHPKGIPVASNKVYRNEGWKGWGDFLSTGNIWKKILT
jgi:hypothetical protein